MLPLSLRLALRELRGGIGGFYILVTCIALGVASIAAVAGLTASLQDSLRREGRVLLGGDLEANLLHRRISPPELAFLSDKGQVSEVASLRAMARRTNGSAQALIDLKAVDDAYPLYDAVAFHEGPSGARLSLDEAIGESRTVAAAPYLLDQLGLKIGDHVQIGAADFTITAAIAREPDALSGGIGFGARALISLQSLKETGLEAPGALIVWRYRLKLPEDSDLAQAAEPGAELKRQLFERFPEGGFSVRDHNEPTPGINRSIGRLGGFLTLAGLTTLLVGGIGAANAVAAFVEKKRRTIAVYKALGASGRQIVTVFLLQTLLLASLGVVVGLIVGAAVPFAVGEFYGRLLPFRLSVGVYPRELALAAVNGLLVSLAFILWPLGRAWQIRAAELLREAVSDARPAPPWPFMAASAASLAGLAASAVALSPDPWVAFLTCIIVGGVFLLFWALGWSMKVAARAVPRPERPELALALCAIGAPGGSAPMLATSLGAALTMLTTVALVDTSLTRELESELPRRAPSHFFVGVPKADYDRFARLMAAAAPQARLDRAPELRGRFVTVAGMPVEAIKPPKDAEWALKGDRGLTFSDAPPEGARLTAGEWWPVDYQGAPLVSFDDRVARALGLRLGDQVTVNVLGRNITATIANFRTVKWDSLGINFVMIFSPNTLASAPYNFLATLTWPGGGPDSRIEGEIARAVAAEFPTVTVIRVRDALETVHGIVLKIMSAIRAAGLLTLIMGGFVMAGALAAAGRSRIYQAVILKTVGAPPRRILAAHVAEHLALALATAGSAAVLGSIAAYGIVTGAMDAHFTLSVAALLRAAILGAIFALTVSAYDSHRALKAKAAPYLRAES